jgi:hypothetical protein
VKSFAGFWRDGSVVQPEARHWKKRRIVARWKDSEWYEVLSERFVNWHQVYWLDTTTPTELSPQEALECYKTIWPFAERINKTHGGYYVDFGNGKPIINWGDLTEYPPKQHWRVPTDADKGKKCRCWDIGEPVLEGVFVSTHDDRFVVLIDDEYLAWDCCEVQDEA